MKEKLKELITKYLDSIDVPNDTQIRYIIDLYKNQEEQTFIDDYSESNEDLLKLL